jgi:GT2 family glycosyltransferase
MPHGLSGNGSVVVSLVTFNDVDTIVPTLEALFLQEGFVFGETLEVIVRDNASSDGTAARIKKHFADRLELIEHNDNLGFCRAHNLTLRQAMDRGADYVFLLNPDLRLESDCLQRLCQALAQDPRAGSACPKLVRADEKLNPVEPRQIDSTGMVMTPNIRHFDRGADQIDVGQFDREEYVFGGTGAALLLRRDAILDASFPPPIGQSDSLELLDEVFFAYREDADLAWRLQRLGWKCRYIPSAVGYHERHVKQGSRADINPFLNRLGVQNRFFLQLNNVAIGSNLHGLAEATLRNLLVFGAICTIERSSLPALKTVWQELPRTLEKRRWIQGKARVSASSLAKWFSKTPFSESALPIHSTQSKEPIKSVQVIIINYNSGQRVQRCVEALTESLSNYQGPLDIHIRVVDNDSRDESAQLAAQAMGPHPSVSFDFLTNNSGFSGGINRGAANREADAYLILNPDILVDVVTIEKMVTTLNEHPELGTLSPVLYGLDGLPQFGFTARRLPTLSSTLTEAFCLHRFWPENPWTQAYLLEDEPFLPGYMKQEKAVEAGPEENLERPFLAEQPAGACLMIRGSVFEELGGFDESFWPAWFEDVDFARRCLEAGYLCGIQGNTSAIHEGGYSLDSLPAGRFVEIWYQNLQLYWEKHGSSLEQRLLKLSLPPALLLRSGLSLGQELVATLRPEGEGVSKKESSTLFQLAIKSLF